MQPWEFAERILHVASIAELEAIVAQSVKQLGFEHHTYVAKMQNSVAASSSDYYQLQNLGREAWQTLYGDWQSSDRQATDVRFLHARAGLPATAWSVAAGVAHTRSDLARNARGLLRAADSVGLRGGVTIPIWSPGIRTGLMTLSTRATSNLRELVPTVAPALYLASCLSASVQRLLGASAHTLTLSEREREILHWVAIGKSSWDISRILALSEATVNYHLQRAAKRLHVRGRQAACARALALNFISL